MIAVTIHVVLEATARPWPRGQILRHCPVLGTYSPGREGPGIESGTDNFLYVINNIGEG